MKRHSFFCTLAISAAILLVGGLLLWVAGRFLPEKDGQIRVYPRQDEKVFLTPETDEEIVLYPWAVMKPYEDIEKAGTQEEKADISERLADLAGDCVSFFIKNGCVQTVKAGKLTEDPDGNLLGMRDAIVDCTLWDFAETDVDFAETDVICDEEFPSREETFSVSFAVRMREPQTLCYLEIIPLSAKTDGDEKNGYGVLCAEAKNASKADPTENRFVRFFNNYINFCAEFGLYESEAAYSVYDAVCSGEFVTFLYGGRAYFCYTFRGVNLTVFCDPKTETILGFSAESTV